MLHFTRALTWIQSHSMQCIEMKASNLSAGKKKMTICIFPPLQCAIIYTRVIFQSLHLHMYWENSLHFAWLMLQNEVVKFKWNFFYDMSMWLYFIWFISNSNNICQNERNYSRAHTTKKEQLKTNWKWLSYFDKHLKMCQINHLQTFCGLLLLTQ